MGRPVVLRTDHHVMSVNDTGIDAGPPRPADARAQREDRGAHSDTCRLGGGGFRR